MARALFALLLTASVAGQAYARRQMCEVEELISLAPPPADPAPAPPPAPVCVLGADDDPRCHPDERLPGPAGGFAPLFHDTFVLARPPRLVGASSDRLARARARAAALAPGHARRIDRPPRRSAV